MKRETQIKLKKHNENVFLNIKKNLMVAIPNTGEVRIEMLPFLMANVHYIKQLVIPSKRPIYFNRNQYVEDFLRSDCDWLLMLDSDTIPQIDALDKVEEVLENNPEVKILSGIYNTYYRTLNKVLPVLFKFNKKLNIYQNYSDEEIKEIRNSVLYKVDGTGGGFLLVHKSVIQKMAKPIFDNRYNGEKTFLELSEDLYFCSTAKSLKIPVYATGLVQCTHIKYVNL